MADSRKYYYLKLKDNFYDSEQLIILQNMQDGYLYSDILMKLYLRSLKTEGKLMFNNIIPYTPQVLAQVVRHQVGTVEKALKIFRELGLIEVLDNGAIYMLDIQNFIGRSSTEADRQREYYNKIKDDNKQCKNSYKVSLPEIEIEIEKEIDIEIYKYIVDYLNQKTGKNFKVNSNKTKSLIKARLNEGFTKEDFVKVIDIKTNEWLKTKMEQYLRPETLFSNKFEGYLNQNSGTPNWLNKDVKAEKISDDELKELEEMMREFR